MIVFASLALMLTLRGDFVVERSVASPDGKQVLKLERDDGSGKLAWSVVREGRPVVSRGDLGLELDGLGTIGDEGVVSAVEAQSVDTTWTPPYGEQATVRDHFNEEIWSIDGPGHGGLEVRLQARAYDAGVAFRYLIGGAGSWVVTSERTSFPLPESTQVWVSSSAQGAISKVPIGSAGSGLERPLTAELAGDLFAAFGEAGLRDHARMKFSRTGASTLVPSLSGSSTHEGSFATPWRYVRVGDSPVELIQGNHLLLNLNEPSEIGDTSWVRPGKVLREMTLTTTGGMACVDWAAAHGVEYVHFDAGWYGNEYDSASDATTVTVDPNRSPGPLDLPAVIAYANSKNIGVILYVNRRALEAQLDELLPLYQSWGIKGIKFGFVNVGSQYWTDWLHDAIAACAEHGLMVDVHDEYRMTGVERTLPNFMTAEGVRGDEESPKNEDVLKTIFTRSLAGAADHTYCYFADRVWTMGSHASQLAKTVCVYSPWQYVFWYDRPAESPGAGGTGSSGWVLQEVPEMTFFERLPTVWDETRWIDGYPGSHATVARRKGDDWFLGALNGVAAREFEVPLDFLASGQHYRMELFYDDPTVDTATKVRIDSRVIDRSHVVEMAVASRNGFAAILTPTDDPLTPPAPLPPPTCFLTFKQGADLLSSDGLFEVSGYAGVSDTSLVEEVANHNYGRSESLKVGVLGNGKVRDALLRYDLSAIAGEYREIKSMTLRLHVASVTNAGTSLVVNTALQKPGNAGWVEGSADGQLESGAACYSHARHDDLPWLGGSNGARRDPDLLGSVGNIVVTNETAPAGTWLEIPLSPIAGEESADSLTKIVDQWTANGGVDNAGLLLVYGGRGGWPEWRFSSSDASNLELRPELVVEFTPAHPYARWAERMGLAEEEKSPELDPDRDGLANVFESLFGTDPQVGDRAGANPVVVAGESQVVFRYRRSSVGRYLFPQAQISEDLKSWRNLENGIEGVVIAEGHPAPDGTPTQEVILPRGTTERSFLRLAVEDRNQTGAP